MSTGERWRRIALCGCSTVVTDVDPNYGDRRIPAYGYDDKLGWPIGHPVIEDSPANQCRLDFVCYTYEQAALIAAAPEMLAALKAIVDTCNTPTRAMVLSAIAAAQGKT